MQTSVRPVVVVVLLVLAQQLQPVALVPNKRPVQQFASAAPDPPFMIAFARGARTGLRSIWMPAALNAASNAAVNFVSRSRSTSRTDPSSSLRSRCHRSTVSGVTNSRRVARRDFGTTSSSSAISARSGHASLGRVLTYRCSTVSW